MVVKSIDLWTEKLPNHYECFNGAFLDGFVNGNIPFDEYKIINNCNCIITCSRDDIHISNKHKAIVFYCKRKPVRLMVINKDTDVKKCISIALSQNFNGRRLSDLYENKKIESYMVDLKENSILNNADVNKEIDVGSCDRWNLLYSMLKGSYTEDNTPYGNFQSDKYEFIPNITIKYELKTDIDNFIIEHNCAFINEIKTRIIAIQDNSILTNN